MISFKKGRIYRLGTIPKSMIGNYWITLIDFHMWGKNERTKNNKSITLIRIAGQV